MNDVTYNKLNPTQTIQNSLPAIIEAFVTFYGESERKNIENKFKNMLIVGYCSPEKMNQILNEDKKKKESELIDKFLGEIGIEEKNKEQMKKNFFGWYGLENAEIKNYIYYLNGNKALKLKVFEFVHRLNPEVTYQNLDKLIESNSLKEFNKYIDVYNEIMDEYKIYKESIKPYNNYLEKCNELKNNLEKKYTKKLINSLQDLFDENELIEFNEKFEHPHFSYSLLASSNNKLKNLIGIRMDSPSLISSFSKESDEILNNGNNWRKDSIIRDRKEYFKNLGLDLGNDYELYKNDTRINHLIPNQELIERIANVKSSLHTEMKIEYYQSLPEFQLNKQRIDAENLLDKDDGYDAATYENNKTQVTTNLKETENSYISYPVLYISMGGLSEYLDKNVIHELNHIFELNLNKVENNKYHLTNGWDLITSEINTQKTNITSLNTDDEKRNYELINEIVNELIAQEITEILFQTGTHIFTNKEDAKIQGGTGYENTRFLINQFYETYKQEIIESRKTGDMTNLFETVGKDNFEDLNNLFHVFNEHFSGLKFLNVLNTLDKGQETEETKIFQEIITKRNEVLQKMAEYNNKKAVTL